MANNQKRILEMLAKKQISVEEAQRLLSLVEPKPGSDTMPPAGASEKKRDPKYLRVVVQPNAESGARADAERVNIRVPMSLVRAGMKLTSLIPAQAYDHVNEALREKGIDYDLRNLKAENLEDLVGALSELEVDVQSGKEQVRIYME